MAETQRQKKMFQLVALCLCQLAEREAEMQALKDATLVAQKQQYQQDQIQDRLRHYEAQAQLVDTLQNELTAAQVGDITLCVEQVKCCAGGNITLCVEGVNCHTGG